MNLAIEYKLQEKRSRHKDIFEKYHYSSQQKEKSLGLPPRPPQLERPIFSLFRVPPEVKPDKDWRMCLTQYRTAEKYPKAVASYEQSVIELSRKIRNKSLQPCKDYKF
eukprot:TRINITY_DN21732_c0_g1_i1.p2 TRINITY_DN21732_c0_g1~~TRINITY_DN21732_c0_g1_i1.p2  ORF type:complete len:108 (-),score=18.83 TRINITY_DN21732_c0_g1_i1:171-494(-)